MKQIEITDWIKFMATSTIDPSHSLFVIAIYSFTETICWYQLSVRHCRCTGQSNAFCPYGAHNSSKERHVGTKKE